MNTPNHSTTAPVGQAAHAAHAALDISALVAADQWNALSPAIRRRFASGHADVSYVGDMELRTSLIGRVFGMAASLLGSPLAASRKHAVEATVNVRNDGAGGVVWERILGNQSVRSTKRLGPDGGLEECTSGGLSMHLDVRVEDGALVFASRGYFLLIGPLRIPVPAWLTPGTCRAPRNISRPGAGSMPTKSVHPCS